ncbi:metallophosphoesterase [Bradyrhizobium guangzhouense]|uniref:Metallophosphoesterase n=1 Tax=Bradyrhizobium guangzhouense TaxID=1325095 RepID=A0AAE5X533_9BRAD|nr:metallophosphoesterase [Bradyrhizobium guangzhouense]QAU48843.1 metallophosphoesterase [Bradyrhizobium guangzhouense]
MRLWPMSDLHLELTRGWDLPSGDARPDFDVMIVAGDLAPRMERGVAWLRERVQDRPVLYIPGNHEFYGCDIDRTVEKARATAAGTNIHVLQNDVFIIDDITFLGATMWTDFDLFDDPAYAMMVAGGVMNDYRKIRHGNYEFRLRPEHTLSRHLQSRDFIARELRKGGRHVVISHHGPVPQAMKRGFERDISSAAYCSDLRDLIREGAPELWIYGHTHESRDLEIRSTRLVSNAKGYGPWPGAQSSWDNPDFDDKLIIEI